MRKIDFQRRLLFPACQRFCECGLVSSPCLMGWRFWRVRWLAMRSHGSSSSIGGCLCLHVSCVLAVRGFDLHKLPAETAFDAEIAVGHAVVQRRCHADNLSILLMHGKVTAHAAVRANGVSLCLTIFIPCAGLP